MTKIDRILDVVRGCLIGSAVGDALGAPYEILEPLDIAYGVSDPDGVTGFIKDDLGCNEVIKERLRLRPVGTITDDTQLSDASATSLIKCGGFDRADQVRAFVEAFCQSSDGWGGTTKLAAKQLGDYLLGDPISNETEGRPGRDPLSNTPPPTEPGKSCGNGVAMKIAPLALYHGLTYPENADQFFANIRSIGLMTHGDPRAWIAAMAIALAINEGMLSGPLEPLDRIPSDPGDCGGCENMQVVGLEKLAHCIVCNTGNLEQRHALDIPDNDSLAHRMVVAFNSSHDAELLREAAGTSCYSLESIPFSIATFMRHPTDFRTAVLEAVNAGGDTDTNAAMVGAMVGANVGESGIPKTWIRDVPACVRMRQLADDMYSRFYLSRFN